MLYNQAGFSQAIVQGALANNSIGRSLLVSQGEEATRGQIALLLYPNDRANRLGNQKRAQLSQTMRFSGERVYLLSHAAFFVVARAINQCIPGSKLLGAKSDRGWV